MTLRTLLIGTLVAVFASLGPASATEIVNEKIDMAGHLETAMEAAKHRESRRVTETEFLSMMKDPGTVILDARSKQRFDELHIRGAVNLTFADITIASLETLIPDKNTRILIYCNNNFIHAERPFPGKMAVASLNLSTYAALYAYGYRNVYELGPLLDVRNTRLPLAGSLASDYR